MDTELQSIATLVTGFGATGVLVLVTYLWLTRKILTRQEHDEICGMKDQAYASLERQHHKAMEALEKIALVREERRAT